MGCWSVYCGLSNISIVSGQKCAVLMLKKNERESAGYLPYLPACIPIFGEYNDYGGLESVKTNRNTKLIEEHFGITIDEFLVYFLDGKHTYERDEYKVVKKKMKNEEEVADWNFMWIDAKVYKFMSTNLDGWTKGNLDFGDENLLTFLGFEFMGENKKDKTYDSKRFNKEWKFGDKYFYSDGNTLLPDTKGHDFISYYKHEYCETSNLTHYITIPEEKTFIGEKAMWQLGNILSEKKLKEQLGYIIGKRYDDWSENMRETLYLTLLEKHGKKIAGLPPQPKTLADKYIHSIKRFQKELAELVTIRHNLNCMSGHFPPFIKYLTPQCGEVEQHQVLLEKFAQINKSYFREG